MAPGLRYRRGLRFRLVPVERFAAGAVAPPEGRRVRRRLGPGRAAGAVGRPPGAPGRGRSVVAVHRALRIEGSRAMHEERRDDYEQYPKIRKSRPALAPGCQQNLLTTWGF